MNTYLVPICESTDIYIRRIVAKSEKEAEEKLYLYFLKQYPEIDGDSLEEIQEQLWDFDADYGQIYDIEEFN